jgi:hypothetical protein
MGAILLTKSAMTETEILDTIKTKAMALWGADRWLAELTRKHNVLYHPDGDTTTAYRNKRSQLGRTFDSDTSTSITTVIKLADCVGLKLSIE